MLQSTWMCESDQPRMSYESRLRAPNPPAVMNNGQKIGEDCSLVTQPKTAVFIPNLPVLMGVVVRWVQIDLQCNKCQFAIASMRHSKESGELGERFSGNMQHHLVAIRGR